MAAPRSRSSYAHKMRVVRDTEISAREVPRNDHFLGTCRECRIGFYWGTAVTGGAHNTPGCPFCGRPIKITTRLSTLRFHRIERAS